MLTARTAMKSVTDTSTQSMQGEDTEVVVVVVVVVVVAVPESNMGAGEYFLCALKAPFAYFDFVRRRSR